MKQRNVWTLVFYVLLVWFMLMYIKLFETTADLFIISCGVVSVHSM